MTIGYGAQRRLGHSSIKARGTLHIDILTITIKITEDVLVKVSIADKVGEKRPRVEGIVG